MAQQFELIISDLSKTQGTVSLIQLQIVGVGKYPNKHDDISVYKCRAM